MTINPNTRSMNEDQNPNLNESLTGDSMNKRDKSLTGSMSDQIPQDLANKADQAFQGAKDMMSRYGEKFSAGYGIARDQMKKA